MNSNIFLKRMEWISELEHTSGQRITEIYLLKVDLGDFLALSMGFESNRWFLILFHAFFLKVITIPMTAARNAIGASRTKTNSNPCRIVPAAASSGSL